MKLIIEKGKNDNHYFQTEWKQNDPPIKNENWSNLHHKDRRVYERFDAPLNVIVDNGYEDAFTCDLIGNISRGGIQLESERFFELGSFITLSIPLFKVDEILTLNGTIIWQTIFSSIFIYGIRFNQFCPEIAEIFIKSGIIADIPFDL